VEQEDATIAAFHALGVKLAVTELDVDVLPASTRRPTAEVTERAENGVNLNPYTAGLPENIQKALAVRYADLFRVFVKYRGAIQRVTFWGVTDRVSWLNDFPARGRTNYPLLFDRSGNPKPAFDAVMRVAAEPRGVR
jgi:endo-1,4-beta-xylanase